MKIKAHWRQYIEARGGSGLSQTAYCHQQGLNRKTFSVWSQRVENYLSLEKNAPLELLPVQLEPSSPIASSRAILDAVSLCTVHSLNYLRQYHLVGQGDNFDAYPDQVCQQAWTKPFRYLRLLPCVCATELTKTTLLYIICNHIVHARVHLANLTW